MGLSRRFQIASVKCLRSDSGVPRGGEVPEVQTCITVHDRDGEKTRVKWRTWPPASCGRGWSLLSGTGNPRSPRLAPQPLRGTGREGSDRPCPLHKALQHAPHTDPNIPLLQYFGILSKSSQPRLIGSSREKTSHMKYPEILQLVLPMGDLNKSLMGLHALL